MNGAQPVVVDRDVALAKLKEYRAVTNQLAEDAAIRRLYRVAAAGLPILDVAAAFKQTGLSEKGHPRLALARATWATVYWRDDYVGFSDVRWGSIRAYRTRLISMLPVVDWAVGRDLHTAVPHIPPSARPKDDLAKYFILFEVPDWTEYSADPFLLRHIAGWLFSVHAEWELTDLERSLLQHVG